MATNDHDDQADQAHERVGETSAARAPDREPAAAILRDDVPGPGPTAPTDPAPDLRDINPGEGPGASPGE